MFISPIFMDLIVMVYIHIHHRLVIIIAVCVECLKCSTLIKTSIM